MRIRWDRIVFIILLIGVAFLGAATGQWAFSGTNIVKWPEHIEEDDPRWNCVTMGNQQCGPAEVRHA